MPEYAKTINEFENELAYTLGGCSVIQGMKGLYRSAAQGKIVQDRIHLLFADVELRFDVDRQAIDEYVDALAEAIATALQKKEEEFLISVYPVYHQTSS
jgi:hypothetical protein